jgi:hypothetical protein
MSPAMTARLLILLSLIVVPGCTVVEGILLLPIDPVGLSTGSHTPVLPCCLYPESIWDEDFRTMCRESRAWTKEYNANRPLQFDFDNGVLTISRPDPEDPDGTIARNKRRKRTRDILNSLPEL